MNRLASSVLCAALVACSAPVAPQSAEADHSHFEFEGELLKNAVDPAGESEIFIAHGPLVRVGLRWDAAAPDAIELSFSRDGTQFSPWQAPEVVFHEGELWAGHIDAMGATHYRFRVRDPNAPPSFLAVEGISTLGEEVGAEATFEEPADPVSVKRQGLAAIPNINSRASWGARAPKCSSASAPYRAVFHHTVTPTNDTATPEARLRQTQNYHMDSRDYCDIAYNMLVSRDARVWVGRGASILSGATGGANTGNVAISYLGTYTTDTLTAAQECAGAGVLAWLNTNFPAVTLDTGDIKGHRDFGATACPGNTFYPRIGTMISYAKNGCPSATPAYRGQFVAQSYPPAATVLTLTVGQTVSGWFDLKNTGTATWNTSTRLAPIPRDQASPIAAASWLSPSRAASVAATAAPGAVGRFNVQIHGSTVGEKVYYFGLLQEAVTWFADAPKGGGPADNFIAVRVRVIAADAGVDGGADAGADGGADGGVDGGVDGGADGGGEGSDGGEEPGHEEESETQTASGGCGCAAGAGSSSWLALGALLMLRVRRRSR